MAERIGNVNETPSAPEDYSLIKALADYIGGSVTMIGYAAGLAAAHRINEFCRPTTGIGAIMDGVGKLSGSGVVWGIADKFDQEPVFWGLLAASNSAVAGIEAGIRYGRRTSGGNSQ